MSNEEKSCKERVRQHYNDRMQDLTTLWNLYKEDSEASDGDLGNMYEYGLSFDYVAPGTFTKQRRGYFRYQISWGGPGEEFRFYCDESFNPVRVEFWFLDWFDGAKIIMRGKELETILEIFNWFRYGGSVKAEYEKAMSE